MTALHKASGAGQTAVITLLLDHGADVHAVTEVGDFRLQLHKILQSDWSVAWHYYR